MVRLLPSSRWTTLPGRPHHNRNLPETTFLPFAFPSQNEHSHFASSVGQAPACLPGRVGKCGTIHFPYISIESAVFAGGGDRSTPATSLNGIGKTPQHFDETAFPCLGRQAGACPTIWTSATAPAGAGQERTAMVRTVIVVPSGYDGVGRIRAEFWWNGWNVPDD